MSDDITTDRVESQARKLLEGKLDSVRLLAETHQAVAQQRVALGEAERQHAAAYAAAERTGWTTGQLRQMGIEAPSRRPPGRPRSSGRTRPPSITSNADPTDHTA